MTRVLGGAANLPLVVIVWNDACHFDAGATMKDVMGSHKPEEVTTIGWLMVDDAVGIMLAGEFYDDTYRGRTFIPREMVKTVTHYKLAKSKLKEGSANDITRGDGSGSGITGGTVQRGSGHALRGERPAAGVRDGSDPQ